MLTIELTTLGVGMEAVGLRAVHNGYFDRTALEFFVARAKNIISQIGGGVGRAS